MAKRKKNQIRLLPFWGFFWSHKLWCTMKKLTAILLQYVVNTNLGFFCKRPKKILVPCFLFTFHQSTEPSSERFAAVYSKTQRDALCAHNSQHSQTWVYSVLCEKNAYVSSYRPQINCHDHISLNILSSALISFILGLYPIA